MKLQRLAISCGGTGGHFYPGLAIAREFKKAGGDPVLIVGGKNAPGQCATAESFGIRAIQVKASPPTVRPMGALRFLINFIKGRGESRRIYEESDPQALLCMGSFASIPPAFAAVRRGIPLFLHDGNARLGKANKFLSRYAKALALSFPSPDAAKCACPSIFTGMPLRPELAECKLSKQDAVARINAQFGADFDPAKPVLLAFGGSLGALSLNKAVAAVPRLPGGENFQIIHLSGKGKMAALEEAYGPDFKNKHLFLESCSDMQLLYSAADLIISRAGGSTVAEIACFGKYSILVPYPFAAEDHQFDNASFLASSGGAEIIRDTPDLAENLKKSVSACISSPELFRENGKKALLKASPRASFDIIDMIENIVFSGKNS